MELKNCKIGILIYDPMLRRMLSELLWKNGAVVYATDSDEDLKNIVELIGLDVAVVSVELRQEGFCLN